MSTTQFKHENKPAWSFFLTYTRRKIASVETSEMSGQASQSRVIPLCPCVDRLWIAVNGGLWICIRVGFIPKSYPLWESIHGTKVPEVVVPVQDKPKFIIWGPDSVTTLLLLWQKMLRESAVHCEEWLQLHILCHLPVNCIKRIAVVSNTSFIFKHYRINK